MANRGIAPVDTTTNIGKMRVKIRDVTYVALDPVEAGYGNYTNYSDDELQVFLDDGGDSLTRALGYYTLDLATQAAIAAVSIADHDLKISQVERSKELRATALLYFDQAKEEDGLSGVSDIFDSFEFGGTNGPPYPVIEAAPYPVTEY